MIERYVFRHFGSIVAVGGALAAWGFVWWLVAPFGPRPSLAAAAALAGLNLWVARRLERDAASAASVGRVGRGLLVAAFAAIACVGALGVAAGAWWAIHLGRRVEASVTTAPAAEPLADADFRLFASAVIALAAGAVGYGYTLGHRRLEVREIRLPLGGWPPALSGLSVVQLSDLHLGPLADRDALRAALARVAALQPDLICITGDVADSPASDLEAWIPELARLSAPLGVFAILGNHDRYAGADRVSAALRRGTACRVLRDEVATVLVGGTRLHLVGLEDDRRAPAAALPRLLEQVPRGEPAILLAHRPSVFPVAAAAGVRLTLAGHTHGGQLAVPGLPHLNPARFFVTRYDSGTFVVGAAMLHVSRGLGTSGQRVRVGARPEVTVVRVTV